MIKQIILTISLLMLATPRVPACTSAIIGADMNPTGRPLLWKHRDTSTIDNKMEYIEPKDGCHGYVALFNASDKDLKEAWTGMNDAGFAIMNTASYNIKNDKVPSSKMDKEGIIMTAALKNCVTVDDFGKLLENMPKPLGVEANFGVIDAYGNGAYFETNNYEYVRYDLKDSPDHVLVRTNYSHSGRPGEGYGFIREANALHILQPYIDSKSVTAEVLTEEASRSFWHNLFGRDMLESGEEWIIDQDFIPRYKSTGTFVIEGCKPLAPGEKATPEFVSQEYIMWSGMGYPPCAEIVPVWCMPGGVPDELRGLAPNGHSSMGDLVKSRRDEVFPCHKGNGDKYINVKALKNEEGTGYLQVIVPQNRETYKTISAKRDKVQNEQ